MKNIIITKNKQDQIIRKMELINNTVQSWNYDETGKVHHYSYTNLGIKLDDNT